LNQAESRFSGLKVRIGWSERTVPKSVGVLRRIPSRIRSSPLTVLTSPWDPRHEEILDDQRRGRMQTNLSGHGRGGQTKIKQTANRGLKG